MTFHLLIGGTNRKRNPAMMAQISRQLGLDPRTVKTYLGMTSEEYQKYLDRQVTRASIVLPAPGGPTIRRFDLYLGHNKAPSTSPGLKIYRSNSYLQFYNFLRLHIIPGSYRNEIKSLLEG